MAISFPACDGYALNGTYFPPVERPGPRLATVINAGGGVSAVHYRRFALHLAERGVAVLTYDYRGIGASRPPSLRGFVASFEDWSEFDCAGAIAWMRSTCPEAELLGIGHSFGSILFGGAPGADAIQRYLMIAPHTGYVGDYLWRYRLPMAVLWHGVMPALAHACGYFPGRRLGLGEDIPRDIALQWARRRWQDMEVLHASADSSRASRLFAQVRQTQGTALMLTCTDDGFATPAGARRVQAMFPGLAVEHWVVSPAEAGMRAIGHFGMFRRSASRTLWPPLVAYILHRKSPEPGPLAVDPSSVSPG